MTVAISHALPSLEARLRLRERPAGRPAMYQTWADLLFVHWRVEPERIQRTLPKGLFVDTFDGDAYVGVVPFFMRNIRPRGLPSVPWLSNFLELNVRTYVHDGRGAPGVWFYSLDCNQPIAVWAARRFFHLPYRHATMTARDIDAQITYESCERGRGERCRVAYNLGVESHLAEPGTLEFFLVERYVLFAAAPEGRIFTGRVHHEPYPIVSGAIDFDHATHGWTCDLLGPYDFGVDPLKPDHLCGSQGVDVDVFGLQRHP